MATLMLVFSNGVEGREDEYNDWYNNVHLKEVAAVEGINFAQRFTLTDAQINPEQNWKYLALYEVDESVGADQTLKNMMAAAPGMNMSDSLDSDNAFVSVMSSVTGKIS